MTSYPKNKDTLFCSTFKIGKSNVTLLFGLQVAWMGYDNFEFPKILSLIVSGIKQKWPYIPHMTFNPKNRDTLFSPTFKIEGNKVRSKGYVHF